MSDIELRIDWAVWNGDNFICNAQTGGQPKCCTNTQLK